MAGTVVFAIRYCLLHSRNASNSHQSEYKGPEKTLAFSLNDFLKANMNLNAANPFSPCSPYSEFWVIHNSAHAAKPDLGLQEGEAARLAIEELEKLKGTDAHRLSLIPAVQSLQQLQSLFQSLDKHLFREVLKNNVSFRFSSDLSPNVHGSTSALGVFGNQIVITLNSDLMRHPSRLALVTSLIHQMCHAYLLVCCGFGGSGDDDERHDLKHGLAFSSIVHTIQDLLVDNARIPLPDLFYCSGISSLSHRLPRYRPGRRSLHSYCYFNMSDHEDKIACGAYMRHAIAAAKAKESESSSKEPPPEKSSQLISTLGGFTNSEQLQNYIQLQSNLYPFLQPLVPPTCTTVNMPASGDYQALLNLQTFIAFGDYDPKVVSDLDLSKLCGPPRIYVDDKNKLKESNPSNPLQDLRTYILAIRTSAEPLRRLALIRLYSQQLLKKEINAMHFLEEIYTGSASKDSGPGDTLKDYKPDGDLRRFVQAFLCAAHPDLPTKLPGVIQLEYEETIYGRRVTNEKDTKPATKDNTNLYILQTTGKYKDRLSKLRGKGGLFLEDLDKVKNALDSKEPIQVPDKLFSHTEKASLPAPEPAISSLADLQWLETAEEHRRAYALYQNYLRRRPVLGLRGMPAVGDIIGGVRLEDLERLDRLRV